MSEPQLPPRPEPPRRIGDVVERWLAWFGLGRLVLAVLSVAVVATGSFWLVRTEPPPVEATLPIATTATSAISASTTAAATSNELVLVHVAGAVGVPGVYELPAGARVDDAVRIAGGPVDGADLDGLNLAAPLADGQRVYVPVVGEIDPASVPSAVDPTGEPSSGPIDLNSATAEQLESLPGVGPATAAAIVDDRDRNGPFAAVDDLERVPGIGPAKLAALRDLVTP
jgi:competence protein ComEA